MGACFNCWEDDGCKHLAQVYRQKLRDVVVSITFKGKETDALICLIHTLGMLPVCYSFE